MIPHLRQDSICNDLSGVSSHHTPSRPTGEDCDVVLLSHSCCTNEKWSCNIFLVVLVSAPIAPTVAWYSFISFLPVQQWCIQLTSVPRWMCHSCKSSHITWASSKLLKMYRLGLECSWQRPMMELV